MKKTLLFLFLIVSLIQAQIGGLIWEKTGEQLPGDGYTWSSPLILDGNIYWLGQDNGLACYNAETGEEIWIDSTNFNGTYSHPTGYDGKLFFGRTYDTLSAVNSSDGTIIWNRELRENSIKPIIGEHIFITTNDSLLCLNTSDGTTVWNKNIGGTAIVYDNVRSQLIVSFKDKGKIVAVTADSGNVLWQKELSDTSTKISAFALSDSILIIQPKNDFNNVEAQKFYGLNLNTKQEIWVIADSTYSNSIPAIFEDKVFFASRKSIGSDPQTIRAIDLLTGKFLWSKSIRDNGASNIPYILALDGKVYFENSQPELPFAYICADTLAGDTLFTTKPYFENSWPLTWGSPLIYNNKLYGAKDGEGLFCYDIGEVDGDWTMVGGNRYGYGSYIPGLNEPSTDIKNNSYFQPGKFELHQNYPNPFNPTTTIKYDLKVAGFVSLKVFDIIGQEVASVVSKNQKAGSYQINFNASNLSSGLYIYRLESGTFAQSKKMMLLK
jgi:outer membrane protein assembly factor BamB